MGVRHRQRHADGGDERGQPHETDPPEPAGQPVAEQPGDGGGQRQAGVRGRGEHRGSARDLGRVQRAPLCAGHLDERGEERDHREQQQLRGEPVTQPPPVLAVLRLLPGRIRQPAVRTDQQRSQQDAGDSHLRRRGHPDRRGTGAAQAAGQHADAEAGVEGGQDGPPVALLHLDRLGVHRRGQQVRREAPDRQPAHKRHHCGGRGQQRRVDQDQRGPGQRQPAGVDPADQDRHHDQGDQLPGVRGDVRQAPAGVADAYRVPHLRHAGRPPADGQAHDDEEQRHRPAGPYGRAWHRRRGLLRRVLVRRGVRHGRRTSLRSVRRNSYPIAWSRKHAPSGRCTSAGVVPGSVTSAETTAT